MISADLALAMMVNRATQTYNSNAPAYITYRERTHVSVPSLGRNQSVDRSVIVRQVDNVAIMQDLPGGGQHTGTAFPIIPYFDVFSQFSFSYFANLKALNINLTRGAPWVLPVPAPDRAFDAIVPYMSFLAPRYATDSTDQRQHLLMIPTSRFTSGLYPSEVIGDPQTGLPAHVEMRSIDSDMVLTVDYTVIEGHWMITHGTFTETQHVALIGTFKPIADITFDQFTFPAAPPDPRLAPGSTP